MNSVSPSGSALSGNSCLPRHGRRLYRFLWVLPAAVALQGGFGGSTALAQTTQWTGGAGNWADPAKWTNGVPLATQEARFNQSAALHQVSIQSAAMASLLEVRRNRVELEFASGASLTIGGGVNLGNVGTANTPAALYLTGPASGTATVSATAFTIGLTSGANYGGNSVAVSYTHLTLPTICSV